MAESKQVKVDNWGIFFLQRLQTFFNKTYFCDLTLQFEDNVQLKVHRLVLNACTEYFQVLEQTCDLVNDCLIMPPDLQADVVVPIVNFMYSGILEFQTATFDRLYATARLMNMTVLTKLLDAQKVPISPIPKPLNKRPVAPITWNLQGKKISPKTMDPDLPEQLPGRKLPIWKRKSAPVQTPIEFTRGILQSVADPLTTKYFRPQHDEPPKPTRFDWPEDDAFDTQPFDEISYTSKPILQPTTREKSPKPSTSNFDEVKRSSVKRVASPVYNDNKKVNIQDVKEYIKEQKIRSDYNDYDDSETADNDLQTYDDNDSDDEAQSEETRGILKNDVSPPTNKRVRFSIEGKENSKTETKTTGDVTNHTKIITEVLKKFPQLVQKNKNIRLKILAKGQNANLVSKSSSGGTPVKVVKPVSKVSYMVHKPNDTKSSNDKKDQWSCQKCSETTPVIFDSYHAYRSHLTETHNEKTDSQMCNICGHVSRKQNMLMYHKYVKHNIEPPPIFQFPKCQECAYVALSPSLLIKHQYNHTHQNLVCAECHTAFSNKTDLIRHIQTTGHSGSSPITTFDCTQCPKKFISSETLNRHIGNNHKSEAKPPEKNIITVEEIDALAEQHSSEEKPKEKIKILSDIKVNKPIEMKQPEEKQQSSEAESLSNVASGIAASLGLVNTIVVLDENNQFILQDGQTSSSQQNFILPDNIQNIVSQHQDQNSIQAGLAKNSIGSTDELVMVLTDHDYSDATNNAVLTSDNSNIVVLYSHPVQGQDGFISQPGNLMLNSNMGLVEVNNFEGKACDESIEMIQQEINSHLEEEIQNKENQESPEKMDVDLTPNSQEPLPGIQTIATTQKYMFIPTTTHDNMCEMQENMAQMQQAQEQMSDIHEEMSVIQPEIQENLPDVEENLPGGSENLREMQENIPEVQENLPDMEENLPVGQENHPDMEENLPIGQENLREVQENLPEVQENLSEVQENMSERQENLPEVQENMSKGPENMSEGQENLPEVQENLSEVQENMSEVQENMSEGQENMSEGHEHLPEVQEKLPEVQENLSEGPENLSEMQENLPEEQENLPEVQENLPEGQENLSEGQENFPNADENLPEVSSEDAPSVETPKPLNELNEDQFDEPMEVEESVEMVQQEINRQQLEISESSSSREENETKTTSESEPEPTKESPEIPEVQEESIENIKKELQQHQEEFEEQMEVDSSSKTIKEINELDTEEITSPENFDSTENTDQENDEDLKEEEESELTPNQSTDVLDSGIDDVNQSETCAEISQLSEPESVAQTVDEVSDLPQDESPNEEELSKKPFRISLDFQDTDEKEIELQVNKTTTTTADSTKICNNKLVLNPVTKSKISNLLDDWDDGDTDSQQSDTNKHVAAKKENSINTLINDWEDEED